MRIPLTYRLKVLLERGKLTIGRFFLELHDYGGWGLWFSLVLWSLVILWFMIALQLH